jgi:hypothetical protein
MTLRFFSSCAAAALACAGCLAGCGSSNGGTAAGGGSITLTLDPTSATVPQGQSTTVTGTVARADGFTGDVGIDVLQLPAGVTTALLTRPVNGGNTAVVTLAIGATTPIGQDTVIIQGSGQGVQNYNAYYVLTVAPAGSATYNFTLNTSSVTLGQGASYTALITVNRTNFTSPFTLSAQQLPSGVTATFSTNPVTANTSSVTFMATPTATVGVDTVFIRGTYAGLEDRIDTLEFHVTAGGT